MRRHGTSTVAIGLLLIVVGLAGCGQKGPLYHPDPKPDPSLQPAPTPATGPSAPNATR